MPFVYTELKHFPLVSDLKISIQSFKSTTKNCFNLIKMTQKYYFTQLNIHFVLFFFLKMELRYTTPQRSNQIGQNMLIKCL